MFCFVAKVLYFFFLFEIGGIFVVTILKTFTFLEQLLDDSKKRIWTVALSNWNFLFEKHGLTFWNWKSIFFFHFSCDFSTIRFLRQKINRKDIKKQFNQLGLTHIRSLFVNKLRPIRIRSVKICHVKNKIWGTYLPICY